MSQWSLTSKPNWVAANKVEATAKGWCHVDTGEVLVCLRGLDTANTDAADTVGWSAAVTYSGTAAMVTGDVMTITVTGDEVCHVTPSAYVSVTIGAETRTALYSGADSTDTAKVFKYTVVAADTAIATEVVVDTTITGKVYDIAGRGKVLQTVLFVTPDTTATTVN